MTNEMTGFGVSPEASTVLGEAIAFVVPILTATFLALWRKAAKRSKLQNTLIEAIVRGIDSGSEQIGDADTKVVKRAVQAEAAQAGVTQHLEKAVEKVKTENGKNGKNGDTPH